jgi:carbonic anhydrase/acetyltransferase-like protein (isoleucine patch superfamily)
MIKSLDGKSPKIAASACISQFAYIAGDVEIGENCSIWPGAVIRADFGKITMGKNCHIEDNCVLHGSIKIGDNVIVGHGAIVHASLIGNDVLIGMNSTVLHKAEIESNVVIGAHSLVETGMKVPAESLVVGSPPTIKKLSARSERWAHRGGSGVYYDLACKYMENGF